jgi:hypothetical protein
VSFPTSPLSQLRQQQWLPSYLSLYVPVYQVYARLCIVLVDSVAGMGIKMNKTTVSKLGILPFHCSMHSKTESANRNPFFPLKIEHGYQ